MKTSLVSVIIEETEKCIYSCLHLFNRYLLHFVILCIYIKHLTESEFRTLLMSDSSEEEDLSRFRDVVDNSFTKSVHEIGETNVGNGFVKPKEKEKLQSQRYLEIAGHYNDVKVPVEMQNRIGAKVSAIIDKTVEFIDMPQTNNKKSKIKGGVKLFNNSEGFLSCEEAKDTYTKIHNTQSKKMKNNKRKNDDDILEEKDNIQAVVVTGDYVLSKEDTKCWKSRRKEKLYKYKKIGKSDVLSEVKDIIF